MSARTRASALMNHQRGMLLLPGLLGLSLLLLWAIPVRAGSPEYMKMKPAVGMGVELKGEMNREGLFQASDIEPLAMPRRPKLRGVIKSWDAEGGVLEMFGRSIAVDAATEFRDRSPSDVAPGSRAEISCKVDGNTGVWLARSIALSGIKDSNKIKGTITEMWVDGTAPDTLSLSGLLVILDQDTDLAAALLREDVRQKTLFGRLRFADATYLDKGHHLDNGKLGWRLQYRQYVLGENQYDLTDIYDSDRTQTQPELKGRLFGYINEDLRGLVELRARRKYYLSSDLGTYHNDFEFQLRQAYLLWRNIGGADLAMSVGRQKLKEPREWLWDDYLDAVRLYAYVWDSWGLQGVFIDPVEPLSEKMATWNDAYLAVDYYPAEKTTVTAYWLRRWDSDEIRNREPVWWGLRYRGRPLKPLRAWGDLALMRGTDKGRDLRAWAMDLGTTWFIGRHSWRPSLTVAYAYGSGNEPGTGHDNEFRQTGYQDNTTRYGGITSVRYYGALLDPELSNLAIATVGAGVRPGLNWSLEILFHNYRQDWAENDLRGSLVDPPARPNGASSDIGWELDLVLGVRRIWSTVKASWSLGVFHPGEAFTPRQETALMNKLNFIVEI